MIEKPHTSPIAVIISADTEWRATLALLGIKDVFSATVGEWFVQELPEKQHALFFHGGWGKIAAAASAQYVIDRWAPSLIVNLGTCGGFRGRIERGEIVLAECTLVYDIIEQMGDPDEAIAYYLTTLDLAWLHEPYPHPVRRTVLVSADRDIIPADIPRLVKRYGAVAADWESGAIAWVATRNGTHCLILRGVTDLVDGAGGEAYDGTMQVFAERTRSVITQLLSALPEWIACGERTRCKGD